MFKQASLSSSRLLLCLSLIALGAHCAAIHAGDYPPPPEPPPPPPGLAQVYYSTCAGTHPPVKYVTSNLRPGDDGYEELQRYANSPEYRRYLQDLDLYKQRHEGSRGEYGEVDARSGDYVVNPRNRVRRPKPGPGGGDAPETPRDSGHTAEVHQPQQPSAADVPPSDAASGLGSFGTPDLKQQLNDALKQSIKGPPSIDDYVYKGQTSFYGFENGQRTDAPDPFNGGVVGAKLNRNPRQDLARWFRGFQYQQAVNSTDYDDSPITCPMDNPEAGPAQTSSQYARMVNLLKMEASQHQPSPTDLVKNLGNFWESHWRRNLGFDADPSGKRIVQDLERAFTLSDAAHERFMKLNEQASVDEQTAYRMKQQVEMARKEADLSHAKAMALRKQLLERLNFTDSMVALLRLAPHGGFGPTFDELEPAVIQESAAKILGQLGTAAAGPVWAGLIEDLAWLDRNDPGNPNAVHTANTGEKRYRSMAVTAATNLLQDRRLEALPLICEYLTKPSNTQNPAVQLMALDLLDKLGTSKLEPEVLNLLPQLIGRMPSTNKELGEKARLVLMRVLGVRSGKASMSEAIKWLGLFVDSPDQSLAQTCIGFLEYHTGQKYGSDKLAWEKLYNEIKAHQAKVEQARNK